MKKLIFISVLIIFSFGISGCAYIAEFKKSANQMNYISIGGKQGILTLHTFQGDKVIKGAKIIYIGYENDDVIYTKPDSDSTFYYSGPCSFEWRD